MQAESAINDAVLQHNDARNRETDILARLPLFSTLSPECLEQITTGSIITRYGQGATLLRQGEIPKFLHIVLEGQIGLLGIAPNGEETIVEILRDGECFIAAAVLTRRPYLMGAMALQTSRVLLIPADRLYSAVRSNPDLAISMLLSLSTHYRALVREVKDLKLKSGAQRLAHYLISLSPKRNGSVLIRLPHSKGVMAARIGVRAETLSRAFTTLREHGVSVKGLTVSIENLERLSDFCMDNMDGDENFPVGLG